MHFHKSFLYGFSFLVILAYSAHVYSMEAASITKPKLRVSPIIEKLTNNLDVGFRREILALRALDMADKNNKEFVVQALALLRETRSFEYLMRNADQSSDIIAAAMALKIKLRVLTDDLYLKDYVFAHDFNEIKTRIIKVLLTTVELAHTYHARSVREKSQLTAKLSQSVTNICETMMSLAHDISAILQEYSSQVLAEVHNQYGPLNNLRKNEDKLNACLNCITETEGRSLKSFGGANSKNAKLTLMKKKALDKLMDDKVSLKKLCQESREVFLASRDQFCQSLGALNDKMLCLHHHVGSIELNLCRLPEDMTLTIFNYLLENVSTSTGTLIRFAFQEFSSQNKDKTLFILQRCICEAHSNDESIRKSIQGRIWEIGVALFLNRLHILSDMSAHLSTADERLAREFDVVFCDSKMWGECKSLKWDNYFPKEDLQHPDGAALLEQLDNQHKICLEKGVVYVLISKKVIPPYLKKWLDTKKIPYIDKNSDVLNIVFENKPLQVNFTPLHLAPYYIKKIKGNPSY